MQQLSKAANILTDVLLPPLCLSCKKEGGYLCRGCRDSIDAYKYFVCPICKRRSVDGRLDAGCRKESGLTRYLGAPLPYSNETVKKIIHSFKYRHAKELAIPLSQILIEFLERNNFQGLLGGYYSLTFLGGPSEAASGSRPRSPRLRSGYHARFGLPAEALAKAGLETRSRVIPAQQKNKNKFILVPVPLYNFRERERGFNQASEIAKYIGEYYEIALETNILSKQKNTPRQADILEKEKRQKNLDGAFSCLRPEIIENKIAILVDDVYTTGTTMRECARVLRTAGVRQVWGMTVARG